MKKPRAGFEPATYSLQGCCSSRWATEATAFPFRKEFVLRNLEFSAQLPPDVQPLLSQLPDMESWGSSFVSKVEKPILKVLVSSLNDIFPKHTHAQFEKWLVI